MHSVSLCYYTGRKCKFYEPDNQNCKDNSAKGGHFERLIIALTRNAHEAKESNEYHPEIASRVEAGFVESTIPDNSQAILERVIQTGEKYSAFEPLDELHDGDHRGIARLYLPFMKEGQLYAVIGAESTRQAPFENKQEVFLRTTGPQLVVALENIRLTEQAKELAAVAERGRIAREIHIPMMRLFLRRCLPAPVAIF